MMLLYYLYLAKYLCIGALIVSLLIAVCMGYAYSINAQRSQDDPERRIYRPGAFVLAFFTWPFLIPLLISLFLLRVLFYGIFMIVFIVLLVLIPRSTLEPTWVEKKMGKVGDALLEANAFIMKLLLKPWANEPEPI